MVDKGKGTISGNGESVAVVNVTFYQLCRQIMFFQYVFVRVESHWYWDKQRIKWRLG